MTLPMTRTEFEPGPPMHLAPEHPVRVAVETTGIYTTNAGVARYVRGLLRGLSQIDGHDSHEFGWPVENLSYVQPMRALKTIYREWFWGKILAPRQLKRDGFEIMHSTSGMFIRVPEGVRHVITLHDMSITRHPERFRTWQISSWTRRLGALAKADRILAISKFTADEAIRLLGLPASKFDVVYNGCDFHPDEPVAPERAPEWTREQRGQGRGSSSDETRAYAKTPLPHPLPAYGEREKNSFPDEFFLFVGSLEPGKNLKLLKQAYLDAEAQGKSLPPLVIVGARWQGVSGEGPPPNGWIYMGRQDDQVLVWLYRRALALVFPSIYEGFGLPVVEAHALGCPVICSPTSSLPEVSGGASMMTELTPVGYIESMRTLAGEPSTRTDLIAAGRDNARRFSWKQCAQRTVDVYRRALAV